MSTLDIVDIHTHLWPPAWGPGGAHAKPSFGLSEAIYRKIIDPQALLDEFAAAGVSLAVVSTTIESLFGAQGPVDPALIAETNDWLGALAAAHPDRLTALATVDVFAGDAGAAEAERALTRHNLAGLVIDSARDGKFLSDPSARPTLELAAHYRVPVFVHPVAHPDSATLIAGAGAWGNSLGRGLMNGVAFLSVLHAGIPDALPELDLIFATLGLGGIVQATRGGRYGRDADPSAKPNIYFDTMGHDPRIIRTLTGFFGPDRVLAGTDWPILPALTQDSLQAGLTAAGLSPDDQALVAGGNARRLLAKSALRTKVAAE